MIRKEFITDRKTAIDITKKIKLKYENKNMIKGQIANPGKSSGIVKIVNNTEDMKKINVGDILVSIATNPNLVPAMKKASAIVTNLGGITSHAAIVSRELGKPCVIGTRLLPLYFITETMWKLMLIRG